MERLLSPLPDETGNPLHRYWLSHKAFTKKNADVVIVVDDHTRDTPTELMLDALIDIVAAGKDKVVDAYAGEMNSVFQKGIEVAKDLFCLKTHDLYDILVVSAGGFPKDRNLYQATKAIENCYRAVVPGGGAYFSSRMQRRNWRPLLRELNERLSKL